MNYSLDGLKEGHIGIVSVSGCLAPRVKLPKQSVCLEQDLLNGLVAEDAHTLATFVCSHMFSIWKPKIVKAKKTQSAKNIKRENMSPTYIVDGAFELCLDLKEMRAYDVRRDGSESVNKKMTKYIDVRLVSSLTTILKEFGINTSRVNIYIADDEIVVETANVFFICRE
jgi:hypothetical protein